MQKYHIQCYLVTLILCSIQVFTFIFCVQIQPNYEVISIWNTDKKFIICYRDRKEFEGRVLWYGPDGRQVGVSHRSNVYQTESEGSSKLFFVNPYKVNSGVYVCKHFRNDNMVISEQFEMKIFNSIDMTGNIERYKIEEGGQLNMECKAIFDVETSEAQMVWTHENNHMVTQLSRYRIQNYSEDTTMHKVIKTTMTIDRVESGDAGYYVCQAIYANSYLSDIKSIDVEVIVQYRPMFEESPKKIIWLNEENQQDKEFSLELKCQAYADPLAKFEWFVGDQSLLDTLEDIPKFFAILTKEHMSILTIGLKNLDKFKYYIKELKENSKNILCKASNPYGNDSLIFDFKFGKLPRTPEILYIDFLKESKFIYLEINFTQSDPAINMFKLVLSKNYHIYFNETQRNQDQDKVNSYKISYDPKIKIEYLDLFAHNPVGWSTHSEMQDTTLASNNLGDQTYEWQLSNFQICVLLSILLLLVASTTFQVVYFNYCDKSDEQDI